MELMETKECPHSAAILEIHLADRAFKYDVFFILYLSDLEVRLW